MSVVADILCMYRAPREVQARRMAGLPREDRALANLMMACVLIFVAQWPRLAREAALDPSIALDARLAGALFAWLMVMPLALYALAFALFVILRALGQAVTGYGCRMALFWALLASTPVWLLSGIFAGFASGPLFGVVSALALVLVIVFTIAGVFAKTTRQEGIT